MIICNDCIHFGVCMGFSNCKSFERRENANVRITGYESDNGKLTAVIVTDETRGFYDKRFIEDRPHGEWEKYGYETEAYDIQGNVSWGQKRKCTNCGFIHTYIEDFGFYSFCPNCGADMRPKEGEAE